MLPSAGLNRQDSALNLEIAILVAHVGIYTIHVISQFWRDISSLKPLFLWIK